MQDDNSLHVATSTISIPAASTNVRIEFGARSDVGKVRPNNQDQYLIARLRKSVDVLAASLPPEQGLPPASRDGYLLLVADGMGGHAGGDRASAFVVKETIKHVVETAKWFFRLDDPDEEVRLRLLREALEKVDRQLIEEGENDPSLAGMGTTFTALSILGADGFIVHVGDSRAYLFHEGVLEQLTRDHTVVQELVRQGLISPEDARKHRLRHVLTNALGGMPGVQGEIVKVRLADGDRLLLCTDGLHGLVSNDQIGEILRTFPSPEEACRELIDAALAQGGRDNVTVVVTACSIQEVRP